MTYKDEEIIYVLTTEDVKNVARELNMPPLTKSQYRSIRKYVERSFAYGPNNWHDSVAEALAESVGPNVRKNPHAKPPKN